MHENEILFYIFLKGSDNKRKRNFNNNGNEKEKNCGNDMSLFTCIQLLLNIL